MQKRKTLLQGRGCEAGEGPGRKAKRKAQKREKGRTRFRWGKTEENAEPRGIKQEESQNESQTAEQRVAKDPP